MTLSAQLETLRRQGSQDGSSGSSSAPPTGEFSFLRRKLAQFRSGKWKRSGDGNSMVRSQSWNQGLQLTGSAKLKKDWSTSLTSLVEGETLVETAVKHNKTCVEADDRSLTRSQSVCYKQSQRTIRRRPGSFAGESEANAKFYRSLANEVAKPLVASCEGLHENKGFYARYGFQQSLTNLSEASDVKKKQILLNDGRSRSLTHMDALEPGAVFKDEVEDSENSHLIVPPLQARRQKLARSQVSSSEYFSVSFEIGTNNYGDEFLVASKGTSLAEVLHPVCTKRGVDLTAVNVYLDNFKTPLPILTTETSWLGGKHILIKGKDESPKPTSQRPKEKVSHSRTSSGYYRGRGRFYSASTEDADSLDSPDCSSKTKTSRQRWSGLFGNTKDAKMEALVDHLNHYSKHGIPQQQKIDDDMDEALYNLEDDWRTIVDNNTSLSDRLQQQQTAIWELVQTEAAYIHTLKVVTDLFLSCLANLQASNILTDVDKNRLFSNVMEIYSSNCYFWVNHVLPMLTSSRDSGKALNPQLLQDGFLQFEEIFRPYTKFCVEQSQCQQYCREKNAESEPFTTYLVWCETQKDCNRLRLMDILVKPMQRLTKYSLLLRAIQKHSEADSVRVILDQMVRKVDLFVNNVNTTLQQKQDLDKLRAIISKIEAYDVVESKDEDLERLVRSFNDLDLTCPMPGCCNSQRRHLLLEGDLKIKDSITSKMDVHCYLFTDMLLICKAVSRRSENRYKVFRQPYLVERLVVQELTRDAATLAVVYLSEYKVPCGAFLLTSSDTKVIKNWMSTIKKAQDLFATAKQATTARGNSILALSRQPSSYYEDEWHEDTDIDSQSVTSLGLFPLRSPRGSTRGSSLNHSHSGSVEMEGSSGSMNQSRGVSMENEVRGSSHSSEEGLQIVCDRGYHSTSPCGERRTCTSPNTLSIQVPVFSSLGQSLPDLNEVSAATRSSGTSLLVPPRGSPHRGTSYPPPSPPLRRAPALTYSRNPPLLKTRHVASTSTTLVTSSYEVDVPASVVESKGGQDEVSGCCTLQQKKALIKRLARSDKRYQTTGAVEDIKMREDKDVGIQKRLSCTYGTPRKNTTPTLYPAVGLSGDSDQNLSDVTLTGNVRTDIIIDSDKVRNIPQQHPDSSTSQLVITHKNSGSQQADIILSNSLLETSDV